MKSTVDYFRSRENKLYNECVKEIKDALVLNNVTSKERALLFDFAEEDCAWVITDIFCSEGVTEAYISKIWVENDTIYVDLFEHYLREMANDVMLSECTCTSIVDVLEVISEKL